MSVPDAPTLRFRYAAGTHVGLVREHNEDSGFAGPYLLVVADGVGGAAAGEVASASTTYVTSAISMMTTDPDLVRVLRGSVDFAHAHLRDGSSGSLARRGMATTLTAVLSDGHRFALCHIGDSRGYLWRDGTLHQLTRDHTLVQQLVDEQVLTRQEAEHSPLRNVVLQAVDDHDPPHPDVTMLDLRAGDRVLLVSDGVTDLVADPALADVLTGHDLEQTVAEIVAQALAAGGRDNITCVLGEVEEGPRIRRHGTFVGSAANPRNLIDGAAVRRDTLRSA